MKKNESNSLDTVNHDAIEAYTSALSQDSYWRLFVDGFRQRNGNFTGKNAGNFEENELGHLLWASREPNNLNLLKNAALKLYGSSAFLMGKFMQSSRNPLNPSKVFEKATHS